MPNLSRDLQLKDKAAIGIGVPLGVILAFILVAIISVNFSKRKARNGRVVDEGEGVELEGQKESLSDAGAKSGNGAGGQGGGTKGKGVAAGEIRWKPFSNY